MSSDEHGHTTIAGPVADQAVLHGLLAKNRDLGLELLKVRPHRPYLTADMEAPDATGSDPTARASTTCRQQLCVRPQRGHRPSWCGDMLVSP
jgi:hypothetical protein